MSGRSGQSSSSSSSGSSRGRNRSKKRKHTSNHLLYDASGECIYFTQKKNDYGTFIQALHEGQRKDTAINGRPVYSFRLPPNVPQGRDGKINNPNITDYAADWLEQYLNGNSTTDLELDPKKFAEVYKAASMLGLAEAKAQLQCYMDMTNGTAEQYATLLRSVSDLEEKDRKDVLECETFDVLCRKIDKVFLSDKFLVEFLELDVSIVRAILECVTFKVKIEFQLVVRLLKWLQIGENKRHAAELLPLVRYGELSSTELAYLSVQGYFDDEQGVFHDYMADVIKQRVSDLVGSSTSAQPATNEFKFTADLNWRKRASMRTPRSHSKFFTSFNGRHYF